MHHNGENFFKFLAHLQKEFIPIPRSNWLHLAFANIEINGSVFQQCFLSHAVLIVNITLSEVGKDAHTCVLIHDGWVD